MYILYSIHTELVQHKVEVVAAYLRNVDVITLLLKQLNINHVEVVAAYLGNVDILLHTIFER